MSLVKHAEFEMKLAGLDKPGSDYDGMLYDAVMALVKAHASQGHSGGSHESTMQIFNRVINFKILSPLTSNPDEWMEVGQDQRGNCYQSKRCHSSFSYDKGQTWYDLDDPEKKNWPQDMLGDGK